MDPAGKPRHTWWWLRLVHINPGRNCYRHYSLSFEATLFYPCGALVRRWGRIGSYTRTRTPDPVQSEREAEELAAPFMATKRRRGYRWAESGGVLPHAIEAAAQAHDPHGPVPHTAPTQAWGLDRLDITCAHTVNKPGTEVARQQETV